MTDDFAPIRDLAEALLVNVTGGVRKRLLRQLATDNRRRQAARMAAQIQPDGSPFAPRKDRPATRARSRRGAIRRQAMFRKLRLARHLKAGATEQEAWVGFAGRAARIARVHQDGARDAPAPGQASVRYATRVLIGLPDADRERLLDLLLEQVAP